MYDDKEVYYSFGSSSPAGIGRILYYNLLPELDHINFHSRLILLILLLLHQFLRLERQAVLPEHKDPEHYNPINDKETENERVISIYGVLYIFFSEKRRRSVLTSSRNFMLQREKNDRSLIRKVHVLIHTARKNRVGEDDIV